MSETTKNKSIIAGKAYAFALEIIIIYKQLTSEKKEYFLSKQLLRSGTSIGANVNEAISSESKRDFVHKLGISLKEARETSYWLNLLNDSQYISNNTFSQCSEMFRNYSNVIEYYLDH